MEFMLDTNICIYIIKRNPAPVLARLRRCSPGEICISAITLCELAYGAQKSSRPEINKLALAEFVTPLEIAPLGDLAAARYGVIRALLEKQGRSIGPLDMLIAAHALALNLTLVTNNEREFRRVPHLRIANWAK